MWQNLLMLILIEPTYKEKSQLGRPEGDHRRSTRNAKRRRKICKRTETEIRKYHT